MPSISVIIPAYNSAATIAEALDSVLAQTTAADEIIVVDDGSADATATIIRDRYPQVRLIEQANGGPAAARNAGARVARGEWLAFLDADDKWFPRRLERQLQCAAERPAVVMLCGQRRELGVAGGAGGEKADAAAASAVCEMTLEELARHNPIVTSTVLLRRDAFEAVGGFDERFRGPEDYDLWLRVAAFGKRNVHSSNDEAVPASILRLLSPLAYYRHRPGSLSLDERRFMPQILRVIEKAFGPGGALAVLPEWRHAALATQYQQASWMAFCRGGRITAIRHLLAALGHNLAGPRRIRKPWLRLAFRYCLGKRAASRAATMKVET